jgi:hypothetical protein
MFLLAYGLSCCVVLVAHHHGRALHLQVALALQVALLPQSMEVKQWHRVLVVMECRSAVVVAVNWSHYEGI